MSEPSSTGAGHPAALRWLSQPFAAMLLLSVAVLFAGLGQGDIRIDGPIYAWVAKYMVISGDWLNLYYDHGQTPYFNKPPLQFWLMALAFKVLGPSTFSAKLVSVLFGLGCVLILYRLARLRFEPAVAATAGIVLVTTYTFIRNTVNVRLDAGVTFFFLVALYTGAQMMRRPQGGLSEWLWLGAACGLAMLLKGGAALLCVPILAVAFAWQRRWDLLLNWRALASLAVCLVIVLPWYLHQYATWGDAFMDEHFRRQQLGRFGATTFSADPWYRYLKELGAFYWPWLPLAVLGAWRLLKPASTQRRPEDRLVIAWTAVSLTILQVMQSKYDRYLLLVFPAFAIFAAAGLDHLPLARWWRQRALPNLGWMSVLALLALEIFNLRLHLTDMPELVAAVPIINQADARAGGQRPVVFAYGDMDAGPKCAIRFYTNAQVEDLSTANLGRLEPGDVVVVPRNRQPELARQLPAHLIFAEGKHWAFVCILGR